MKAWLVVLVAAVMVSSCGGGSSPTSPSPVVVTPPPPSINLSGGWFGKWASSSLGFGPATVSLTQTGLSLTGNWSITDQANVTIAGTLTGTISNVNSIASGDVQMTLFPSDPRGCRFQFTGTGSTSQRSIFGQFVTTNCSLSASGTLIVDR